MQVREHPQRASRILLDIEAGAPVILIPESSQCLKVLVVNLGRLRVQNSFLLAGAHGPFSLRDKVKQHTVSSAVLTCVHPSRIQSESVTICLFPFLFFKKVQVQSKTESEQQKWRNSSSSCCFSAGVTVGQPQGAVKEETPEEDVPQSLGCPFRRPKIYTASKHEHLIKTPKI